MKSYFIMYSAFLLFAILRFILSFNRPNSFKKPVNIHYNYKTEYLCNVDQYYKTGFADIKRYQKIIFRKYIFN